MSATASTAARSVAGIARRATSGATAVPAARASFLGSRARLQPTTSRATNGAQSIAAARIATVVAAMAPAEGASASTGSGSSSSKGKALISVSDKTDIENLAKVTLRYKPFFSRHNNSKPSSILSTPLPTPIVTTGCIQDCRITLFSHIACWFSRISGRKGVVVL
jgi:hypothetical protein